MVNENFVQVVGKKLLLSFLLLFSLTSSEGNQNQQFSNSCGDIQVSFPFLSQGDSSRSSTCNHKNFNNMVSCDQNNRTVLHLLSRKYYIQSINYTDYSFRLLDPGIQISDICSSVPLSFLSPLDFADHGYPFSLLAVTTVVFLSCENQVESPIYLNRTSYCNNGNDSGNGYYSYVVAGNNFHVRDVADSCSVEALYLSSSRLISEKASDLSWSEFNTELGNGFELSWINIRNWRDSCCYIASCFEDSVRTTVCGDCGYNVVGFAILNGLLISSIIGALIFATRCLCVPCVFGFLIYKFNRRHLSNFDSIEGFLQSQNHLVPIRYSYSDIRKMTNGFRFKLGEGGYGSVYKGKLRSGTIVAVKMLSKPKANGQEFINEVATIGRIHHMNIVELIGYCAEMSKRALVYEFMPNGSLEKYIFSLEGRLSLSCKQIYEISLGVARGVGYLHQGCDMQILHFDIKPHNILLDENFTPKVSDFGLARLYPINDDIVTVTAVKGTLGYMAPELFYRNIGGVSFKADVYSFGMLLMEMAGRRRNWISSADSSERYFPSWVYDQFVEGNNIIKIEETTDEESEMVKKMMLVALWCIQVNPKDRPSINQVIEMLQGNIEFLQMPPKSFLYSQGVRAENNEMNKRLSDLSGACLDSFTSDLSGR